jgi:hypothetical protein
MRVWAVVPAMVATPPALARFLTGEAPCLERETVMRNLIWIALALVVIWVVARLIAGIAGMLLNLLWILAIIVFVVWLYGVLTGKGSEASP